MCSYVNIHTHRPSDREISPITAGVHPWDAGRVCVASLLPLEQGVQAIGETGLDALRGPETEVQLKVFREQLALARERGLPVVIHSVRSFGAVMRELASCAPRAVIFHGFIGSKEQARQAVARGYFLSFGFRTFDSPRTLEALREVPLSHLFLETDDSLVPIGTMYEKAAAARGTTVEELRGAILENYERIFRHG